MVAVVMEVVKNGICVYVGEIGKEMIVVKVSDNTNLYLFINHYLFNNILIIIIILIKEYVDLEEHLLIHRKEI
jgi:hypothetical protein